MDGKLKGVMAVAIAVGLVAGACPAAVSTPGVARIAQDTVSVDRTSKGDRLPLKRTSAVSLAVAVKAHPPVGCDPAFSRVADPARAHIFGRCIS
jgi:hypothetical protein